VIRPTVRRRSGEVVDTVDGEVVVHEAEPLWIELLTSRDVTRRPEILLDGHPIAPPEAIPNGSSLVWRWPFSAEHWCGRTALDVVSDGPAATLIIRSVPSGRKFTADEYDRMLERLRQFGADLDIGLAPGTEAASPAGASETRATHPAVIDYYLEELLRQLARVLRDPVRRLRPVEAHEPYLRVRQASPRTISWLASHPAECRRLRAGDVSVVIPTTRRDETFDHPANRYLISLIGRLLRGFRETVEALNTYSRNSWNGELERRRAIRLADRVRVATRRLEAAMSGTFFDGLSPGDLTETVAQVYAGHPHYSQFVRAATRLLDPGLSVGTGGDLSTSLRRSYDLFELYCLYKLAADLRGSLGEGWTSAYGERRVHVLVAPRWGAFWTAVGPTGERRVLYYQQKFPSPRQGAIAVSTIRRPDFVLADYAPDGALERWMLLDAKYRTDSEAIREALRDMHVYRDSLRWRCPVTGKLQPCSAGYLLVPHVAGSCRRYATPDYRKRWSFGLIEIDEDPVAAMT